MKLSKGYIDIASFPDLFVATCYSVLQNAQSATPQKDSTNSDATPLPNALPWIGWSNKTANSKNKIAS